MKKTERKLTFGEEKIRWWELVILALILLACLVLFYQPDIVHTAVSSATFLKGHILDFYSYNKAQGIPDSYMPSTYVVFALWCAVPYMLGFLREVSLDIPFGLYVYLELLPILVYVASGYVVYLIGRTLELCKSKSRLMVYVTMTFPVALYSQFIFCQYDIFTVFFVLLGIYFYLKDKDRLFVLSFGVAITFKYFALAIFVPMLLLKHKNIVRICGHALLFAVPFALQVLVHYHDPAFVKYVLNFSALGYLFSANDTALMADAVKNSSLWAGPAAADNGITQTVCAAGASALAAGFEGIVGAGKALLKIPFQFYIAGGLCIWSYFVKTKTKLELFRWVMFFGSGMMFAIFAFMFWHPQWLLLIMPFWGMSALLHKKSGWILLSDILFMVLFVMYVSNIWFRELDQGLMENGILGGLIQGQIGAELMIKDCYLFYNTKIIRLGLGAMLLLGTVLRFPGFCISDVSKIQEKVLLPVRLRWGVGLAAFLVPASICLVLALCPPYCSFNGEDFAGHLPGITSQTWLSEVFTVETDDARFLDFYVYDYDRENTGELEVTVTDMESGELLLSHIYDVSAFPNRGWIRLDISDCGLKAGGTYMVNFNSQSATPENSVTLYHTSSLTEDERYYGLYTGQPLGSNLSIKIFEGSAW